MILSERVQESELHKDVETLLSLIVGLHCHCFYVTFICLALWDNENRGIIVSAPVPVPFLWTLDLGFGTWIWDLDLGLDLGLTIIFNHYFIWVWILGSLKSIVFYTNIIDKLNPLFRRYWSYQHSLFWFLVPLGGFWWNNRGLESSENNAALIWSTFIMPQ